VNWDFGWEFWRCRRCGDQATYVNHFCFEHVGEWAEKPLCASCLDRERAWDANVNGHGSEGHSLLSYYLPILIVPPHGDLHLQLELAFHVLAGALDHAIDNERDDLDAEMRRIRRELAEEMKIELDWARRIVDRAF